MSIKVRALGRSKVLTLAAAQWDYQKPCFCSPGFGFRVEVLGFSIPWVGVYGCWAFAGCCVCGVGFYYYGLPTENPPSTRYGKAEEGSGKASIVIRRSMKSGPSSAGLIPCSTDLGKVLSSKEAGSHKAAYSLVRLGVHKP